MSDSPEEPRDVTAFFKQGDSIHEEDKARRVEATNILDQAANAVGKERGPQHGTMRENFEFTAALWTAYLNVQITAQDVAAMNMLQKLSRSRTGNSDNADHYTDMAGYVSIMGALRK